MNDELLKAATRALREDTDDDTDGRFARARVMASLHRNKLKRRTRLAFLLPIAACLAAGTAWGAATGRLPALFHALTEGVGWREPRREPKDRASKGPGLQQPESSPRSPALDVIAAPALPAPEVEPQAPRFEPAPAAKPTPSTSSSGAFRDTDGDLYRLAHDAHFGSHDYARALTDWNAYLKAAPSGRFATEARYNRAICLLRLGRDAEARQALEPFASGAMGYRENEARQLLEELSR